MSAKGLLCLGSLAILTFGCKNNDADLRTEATAASSMSAASVKLWNAYVLGVPTDKLQEECLPRRIKPKTRFKGTVVLFHGFSACPQQFWEMGDKLANEGFDVLLPLLPGHGRKATPGQRENLDEVPTSGEWLEYTAQVKQMADIVRLSGGTRTVGGLSAGGALATYAILAPETRGVWSRSLVMNPLYNSLDDLKRVFPEVIGNTPFVNDWFSHSWGDVCYNDAQNSKGPESFVRGGFCSFSLSHASAVENFGQATIDLMQKYEKGEFSISAYTQVQFVFADFDAQFRKRSLDLALGAFARGKSVARNSGCSFDLGVPHSYLSRYDSAPDQDKQGRKPWLPSLVAGSVAFLSTGTWFAATDEASLYPLAKHCRYDKSASASATWVVPNRINRPR